MLTEIAIKNIPVLEKRREVPDGKITGLYLIVQPSGAKSWALRYRAAGAPRKLTIGPYPAIDIGKARRRAQEALGEIAGGKDPAATKRGARTAGKAEREADVDRVERVVALFIERHVKPKTRDWRETERILFKEIAPRWRGRRLSQITRAHVHEMLDEIIDRAPRFGRIGSSPTSAICADGRSPAGSSSGVLATGLRRHRRSGAVTVFFPTMKSVWRGAPSKGSLGRSGRSGNCCF